MGIPIPLCRALRGAKQSTLAKAVAISVAAVLLGSGPVLAEHTRWWRQSSFEDFDKGTAKGVALRSDGKLFLAPRFAEFADANLAYLLALRAEKLSLSERNAELEHGPLPGSERKVTAQSSSFASRGASSSIARRYFRSIGAMGALSLS